MSVFKVLKYPHVLLRKKSSPVEKFTPDLKVFVKKMIETMVACEGIGLAAPQVGILKRIIVLDTSSYLSDEAVKEWHGSPKMFINDSETPLTFPLIFINPEITASHGESLFPFDGCLSVPGVTGKTPRAERITLMAKNENNDVVRIEADGIMSICLQHELDHLEGVLFIDRASEKLTDREVADSIKDAESDSSTRKRLKKFKWIDAQKEKFEFV